MKTSRFKNNKRTKKTVYINRLLPVFFVLIMCFFIIFFNNKINKKNRFEITPEIARAKEYDTVKPGDEKTDSDFVLFDAFFLKDLDGDNNADSIRGTCNKIHNKDTLYMDLKVINNGYFKDGVITINSSNFNLSTTLVKDQIIAENYISDDTKSISLKEIQNGNQKLITGIVNANIGNDINNYSKINSVTLSGTHVADNGEETQINKTIPFVVDWYGTAKADIYTDYIENEVDNFDRLLKGNNLKLDFEITTRENMEELILKSSNIEGTVPELNGYKPLSFKITTNDVEYNYDKNTGHFTAKKQAIVNEDGIVTKMATTNGKENIYGFSIEYPRDAYENMDNDVIDLTIPLKTFYEGYNNTNSQFQNPFISNTAETAVMVRWKKTEGNIYDFDVKIGKYSVIPYNRYIVSKEKPLQLYNNMVGDQQKDYYVVKWTFSRGPQGENECAIMKETKNNENQVSDVFVKSSTSTESMEDLTSNVGIYLTGAQQMLGTNGWVKIYNDETDELLITFNKDNWNNYTEDNPYYYESPIRHIRVETSSSNKNRELNIFNIKELDDSFITENYTKDQFDSFKYIKTTLNGYFGEEVITSTNHATYEAPLSVSKIDISKNSITTQDTTENQIITITTIGEGYNIQKWKNGIFVIKFPQEINFIDINSVTVDNNDVSVLGYDLYEEDGCYFLKILTQNEIETTYKINIDCNMTPDSRNSTVSRNIELYSINETGIDYFNKLKDIYDIDGDTDVDENIENERTKISLISPNELITNQIAKNYDDNNNITIAPKVARVEKQKRTAEIEINVMNNYTQDVTDVIVQGVIPFEGNEYVIGNRSLESTFSTSMSDAGIRVPDELQNIVEVYYSKEAKPTNDLTNELNHWIKAEDITNWNEIKSYIIDFGEHKIQHGESYAFVYEVTLPEGIDYNEVSYSEHAIYFSLLTDGGKYSTYTAANKVGLMIAKEYDLEIQKYQQGTNSKVQGVTFSITEEGLNNSRIKVTNGNGNIIASGLLAEKNYTVKEIKTTDDYKLNEEEIKFYTYTDENDNLNLVYKNDDGSYSNLADKYDCIRNAELIKNDGESYKLKLEIENEVRSRLKIVKTDMQTDERQKNVQFSIEGKDKNILSLTDNNGELSTKGLYIDEEYTITEKSNKGYYLLEPIKLKINKNNETYSAQILQGNVKNVDVNMVGSIPEITLALENEKIPTYSLQITKIEENHEDKTIANTEILLKSTDTNIQKRITTNNDGTVLIDNLYQYVNGKNISGIYTIKETKAPDGYASNTEEIEFKVSKNGDNLEINLENEQNLTSIAKTEVDGNLVKITIQDKPLFKLIKEDENTGDKLQDAKFVIYEIDNNGNDIDFAKDVNGNYIGELNSDNKYEIKTDSNGEISIPLRNGLYKAVEIESPEGYNKAKTDRIFKISSNESKSEMEKQTSEVFEINYIEDLVDLSNNVKNGNNYSSTKVILTKTLDFKNEGSYRDPNNTTIYGDYNEDGTTETIFQELSKGKGFLPIGNSDKPFKGAFDGQNHEINNIYINSNSDYVGLFGYINSGEVRNISVSGDISSTGSFVGGIIGYVKDSTYNIVNCKSNVNINGNSYVGGILGDLNTNSLSIINCTNSGEIIGTSNIGGILGCVATGTTYAMGNWEIINCYNDGEITGSGNTGGLIGYSSGNIKVSSSCNFGNIYIIPSNYNIASNIGGIEGYVYYFASFNDCYNYGNISQNDTSLESITISNVGGIAGTINQSQGMSYCGNNGDILTINGSYLGGLVGRGLEGFKIEKSYNSGNIFGKNHISGMANFEGDLQNVMNTGDITFSEPSFVSGLVSAQDSISTPGTMKNSINTGTLYYNGNENTYTSVHSLGGANSNNTNIYYLNTTIERLKDFNDTVGTRKTHEELISHDFYNTLNVDNVWVYKEGNIPTLKMPITSARIVQEVKIKNESKKFKITTEVEEINGVKGGTISGENQMPYETVNYKEDSTKQIKIIPDDGFKIIGLTINGESQQFKTSVDGTYTLPQFNQMQEDKRIVVKFERNEKVFQINKIDEATRQPLSGAEFKIEPPKTDLTNTIQRANMYYFPYSDQTNQYISDNIGMDNTFALSFIPVVIQKSGNYHLEINARISSEQGKDIGYATINKTGGPTNSHGDGTNLIEFMNISGEVENKTYKSDTISCEGSRTFILSIVYSKDEENSVGEDALFINSIKLVNEDEKSITGITNEDGQMKASLIEGNYIITETKAPNGYSLKSTPIEFTYSATGEQEITIENTKKPIINVNHYLWTSESGITDTKVSDSQSMEGEIGKNYSTNPNFDIEYEIVRNQDYYGDKTQSEILTIYGKNSIQEMGYETWEEFYNDYYIPQNSSGTYEQTNEDVNYYYKEKTYTLTEKHLLEGTNQNVPSKTGGIVADQFTDGYIKNQQYTTTQSNQIDYNKYELVATPENANGTILSDTEVVYYYRVKDSTGIIVHHYIVGTENKVPNNNEGVVEDEVMPENSIAKVGDSYTTTNAENQIASNYKIATNKDVYGDSIPEGKNALDIYEPDNKNGLYTADIQEVIYYYIMETPIHTSSITKTGTESISQEDEKVNYNITYNAQIQDYIGNATVQIVDQLPYRIDVSKSSLNGGEYNDTNKTITWRELRNLDTYTNSNSGNLTLSKSISVVFKNIDYSKHKLTNIAQGNTILLESNTSTDIVQSSIDTSYRFYRNITVNKVWNDNNNELGIRPNSINVTLKAQDYEIPDSIQNQVQLSEPNWTYTWQNLEKYDNLGREIVYGIEENLTDNAAIVYTSATTTNNDTYTITNTYQEPENLTSLVVNKIWQDNNDENGKRPEKIKIELYRQNSENSTKLSQYILDVSTENSYTFRNLRKYDEKGNKITYFVEEKEVNENDLHLYNTSIGNLEEINDSTYEINITNSFDVPDEKINISVNKVWDDNNNQNNKRPSKVKIVLSKPKTDGQGIDRVEEYELHVQNNESTHTFEDLAKYDSKGNEITYIVSEEEISQDDLKFYTKQISDITSNNCTITNTFTIPSEQITIKAKKIWHDNNNNYNKRPNGVTIKLMNGTNEIMTDVANDSNQWEVTFSNLAKYDNQGNEINYTVKEQEIAQNDLYFYSDVQISGNKTDGFEINNTFTVPDEKIQIPVTKTWNDNNKDRISSIELVLSGNGNTYRHTLTSANKSPTNPNIWTYIFNNLPKYSSNGDEITYTLSEQEIQNGDLKKYIQVTDGYNITNTSIIKDSSIEKDGTNIITSLDDKIEYSLKYTVEIDSNYTNGATITIVDTLPYEIDETKEFSLDGGNYNKTNRTITWTNNYTGEQEITKNISLVYKDIDVTKTNITNAVKGILQLDNGYEEEKTTTYDTIVDFTKTITVNKIWMGDSSTHQNGNIEISNSRPNKVTVQLNSVNDNNQLSLLDEKDITQNDNWQISFENVPKYDTLTRKEIKYQVTENDVPEGYYSNIDENENTFTVTNSKYGSIKITKVDSVDENVKLGGAEFKLEKLKDVNGKMVIDESFNTRTATSSTSDATLGQFEFKNLQYGTYRLTETKAPEGYNLIKNTTDIEINSDNTEYNGKLSNKQKTILPLTGGFGRNTLIAVGIFIIIILILIKKKRIYIVKV